MKVLCIRTCYDSQGVTPYHDGALYEINDKTHESWEEQEFLQYFADPETGKPLMVLPPKPDHPVVSDPLAGVKDAGDKILADVEKQAADILAAAEKRAAEIVDEALVAGAPDGDDAPDGGDAPDSEEKLGLIKKIKNAVTGGSDAESSNEGD